MDLAGPGGSGHGGESSLYSQRPRRNSARGACRWGSSCCFAHIGKLSQVCRYFQRGFCFHGDQCSYQHPQPPGPLEWCRRHSEPHLALPGPQLGLPRRGSEPTYLPSVAVGWRWARPWGGLEPSLEGLTCKAEEVGGSSWKPLSWTSADGDHSYSQESQPRSDLARKLVVAPLQSLDLEGEQDSRDVVCGICMDKVWDKPEAERVFGILPNCPHAHCLGCLRMWRKNRQDFSKAIIKACPQCRIHSSYIIPHKFWVSKGAEKEQLIKNFKARTSLGSPKSWKFGVMEMADEDVNYFHHFRKPSSQIRCRFFVRGNGYCPFKSDCIYLHQLPAEAPIYGPTWPESVLSPARFLGSSEPEDNMVFTDCALAMAFWGSELLLDPSISYHSLL